jgi:hypothetical protein
MNMEQRIEEFTQEGKNFAYYDLSGFKTNDEFREFTKIAKECIVKYAEHSVFGIANIKDVRFDSETKNIIADWLAHDKPYVKFGAVIGFDGIKKIMLNAIFKLCGRKNVIFASSKEQAIELLLKQ